MKADAQFVRDTVLCAALVNEQGVRISTVEHLSAALAALVSTTCMSKLMHLKCR